MLSFLDSLPSNLSKDQFREIRTFLESFYIHQPNQPQTNNAAEVREKGDSMYANKNYRNHSYQLPAPTADQ